jgi:NAD(P)-dependent dehydrogenase (short-subunit alcohol dehydrogenase family)
MRPHVLAGVTVLLAGFGAGAGADERADGDCIGGGGDGDGAGVADHLGTLGAAAHPLPADLLDEPAVATAVAGVPVPAVLVVDAAASFDAAGAGHDGLRRCVDGAWNAVRAVADRCWIDREDPARGSGGRLVLLAPRPGAGLHAAPARAALENLARTLSTEWARYAITTAVLLPGDATTPREIAELVAFLASPAGAYFTGCAFALGGAVSASS